jgi:hypothetical protein
MSSTARCRSDKNAITTIAAPSRDPESSGPPVGVTAQGVMQQCATPESARLSLLVWNDAACPMTARELPHRTLAIVHTDLPLPETSDLIAGWYMIDVESRERAVELAAYVSSEPGPGGEPLYEWIDVREVMSEATSDD